MNRMPLPRKRFGQHFLRDQGCIEHIVSVIDPQPGQHLVEIGPGQGALTIPILKRAHALDAIELDRDLIPLLEERIKPYGMLTLYAQDVLTFDFAALAKNNSRLRVFGNLPYNISTPLLFHLLRFTNCISDMHFMLQKEVAERIAAPVNSAHYGRLSIMMQYHCAAELLFSIGPEAFQPPPKVDSSIIRIIPRETIANPAHDYSLFSKVVREAFNHRRKTLRNSLTNLVSDQDWSHITIDSSLRAEALSIQDYVTISNYLSSQD